METEKVLGWVFGGVFAVISTLSGVIFKQQSDRIEKVEKGLKDLDNSAVDVEVCTQVVARIEKTQKLFSEQAEKDRERLEENIGKLFGLAENQLEASGATTASIKALSAEVKNLKESIENENCD